MQGKSVDLVNFNYELFETVQLDIAWDIHSMTIRNRGMDLALMRCTIKAFRQFENYQHVRWITVSLHPEDVPMDGYCGSVIVSTRDGSVTLQDGIRVVIIDGNHLLVGITELWEHIAEAFNWKREQIPVY